jgi:hypothetical protein
MTPAIQHHASAVEGVAHIDADRLLWALSQVESGDNDLAVGAAGEVSRYQIKPLTWASMTDLDISEAVDPAKARMVALAYLRALGHDLMRDGFRVNAENLILAYKLGYSGFINRKWARQDQRDAAQRCLNLYNAH